MKKSPCIHFSKKEDITCNGHITGILTNNEIKQYGLIKSELNGDCLQITSYDLRLGEGHLVYETAEISRSGKWSPVWIGDDEQYKNIKDTNPKFDFQEDSRLKIKPFGAALVQLKETIDTRTCCQEHNILICGRFDLKLKMVIKGLVSQQATQVEPNYTGKLFCYLFNQTGKTVYLGFKEKLATIEFFYVSCRVFCDESERVSLLKELDAKHENNKYMERNGELKPKAFCNNHGINDVRYFLSEKDESIRVPDHGGLDYFYEQFTNLKKEVKAKIEELDINNITEIAKKSMKTELDARDKSQTFKTTLFVTVVALIVAIIAFVFGGGFVYNRYSKKIKELDKKLTQYEEAQEAVIKESSEKLAYLNSSLNLINTKVIEKENNEKGRGRESDSK